MQPSIRPGIYRHYKGNLYRVMDVATHSETLEKVVVYRPLYGERALWVRPLSMFVEDVSVNGVMVPRFAWESAAPAPISTPAPAAAAASLSVPSAASAAPSLPPAAAESAGRDLSMDERVKLAMSSHHDDKPDFSSMPIFDDRVLAMKVGAGVVLGVLLLLWLL
ncbi:MAG: DUF1653 domain-containing protein [Alcanivoracaceae bacterium]